MRFPGDREAEHLLATCNVPSFKQRVGMRKLRIQKGQVGSELALGPLGPSATPARSGSEWRRHTATPTHMSVSSTGKRRGTRRNQKDSVQNRKMSQVGRPRAIWRLKLEVEKGNKSFKGKVNGNRQNCSPIYQTVASFLLAVNHPCPTLMSW